MDRSLHRGTIGLSLSWLAHPAADKKAHDQLKVQLSHADAYDQRHRARQDFNGLAVAAGCLQRAILDREAELRGGNLEEPRSLSVRGVRD